jgi:hypothetical protein
MTRIATIFATAAAGFLLISPAPAISTDSATAVSTDFCGTRAEIVKSLSEQFKENPTAVGMINGNAVIEVFTSNDGNWTILATSTDGKSCVLSAGVGFEINPAALGEDA